MKWISASTPPDTDRLVQVKNENCEPKYSHSYFNGKWMNPYYKNQRTKPKPEWWRDIECDCEDVVAVSHGFICTKCEKYIKP